MMPAKAHTIKINLPGGIVSAGDLLTILTVAENAEVESVQFGIRQQLLFTVADEQRRGLLQELATAGITCEVNADKHPNIVSSYVTEDVFYKASWLREGVYQDVLDLFDYQPQLKVNLIDSSQTFVPFFTGNLNFIASGTSNYWYLYVRFPKTNTLYGWPSLVYSEDIAALSRAIEQVVFAHKEQFYDQPSCDGAQLYSLVSASHPLTMQPVTEPLRVPPFTLPYYEGFNRYSNKLWLGIYRRDEQFSVAFLKDVCCICAKTRIGQLYTTPWKSLVVKEIELNDRSLWETVLCKYRINVRHAANELNWQVEDLNAAGLELKHYLVRQFNEEDVRTHQLCFAIKTQPKTGLFGSIVIKTQQEHPKIGLHEEQFEILHTRDFNPNSKDIISFRQKVNRESLSWYLIQLCNQFYELQGEANPTLSALYLEEPSATPASETPAAPMLYQCRHCLTRYDETYGDAEQAVAPGTPFAALVGYHCPTCEAPQTEFEVLDSVAVSAI